MKLPRKWNALLAFVAVLVVAFTGIVPGRAKAAMLDLRETGDNLGEPEQPDGPYRHMSSSTPISITDFVVRLFTAQPAKQATIRVTKAVNQGPQRTHVIEK